MISRIVDPWVIVQALLPKADHPHEPGRQVVASTPPLDLRPMASTDPQPVEAVLDLLFRQPEDAPSWHVYALLDAARSQFLPARLETARLDYTCLYDISNHPELGETAPWLVRLDRDAAFTRATLAHDAATHDPRKMLGDGVFFASPLPLDQMRLALKHYTRLRDEDGIQQFFRLQEPGMLDALLCVMDDAQQGDFLSRAPLMIYPRPALEAGIWDFVAVTPPTAAPAITGGGAPVLDAGARKALSIYVNDRSARLLAVDQIADASERPAASWTFSRLMNAGFDHPPRLVETFRLLQRCPPEAYPSFWQAVESGQYSLRRILLIYAEHYRIEGILEEF